MIEAGNLERSVSMGVATAGAHRSQGGVLGL